MSTNCINCVVNKRTSARDCLCDACRLKDAIQEWNTPGAPVPECHTCHGTGKHIISGPQPSLRQSVETLKNQLATIASKLQAIEGELNDAGVTGWATHTTLREVERRLVAMINVMEEGEIE